MCFLASVHGGNLTLTWYHPPKCGTFALTLLRYGCPSLPDDAALPELAQNARGGDARTPELLEVFRRQYPYYKYCERGFGLDGEHARVGNEKKSRDGTIQVEWGYRNRMHTFVTVLREPRDRLLSHFAVVARVRAGKGGLRRPRPLSFFDSERSVYLNGLTADLPRTTDVLERTRVAIARLRDGFAFVGLTKRWAHSVCLFHATLAPAGDCLPPEFASAARPAERTTTGPDALQELQSLGLNYSMSDPFWQDIPDDPVYHAAVAIFDARFASAGLGDAACATTVCPRAAAFFQPGRRRRDVRSRRS